MADKMLVEREGSTPGLAIIDAYGAPAVNGEHGSLRIRLLQTGGANTILVAPSECEQLIEIAKTVMANAAAEKLRQSENPPPALPGGFAGFPGIPGQPFAPPPSAPPPPPWPTASATQLQPRGKNR